MLYWNGTESRWYYAQVVALKVVKDRIVESCKQIERTVSGEEGEQYCIVEVVKNSLVHKYLGLKIQPKNQKRLMFDSLTQEFFEGKALDQALLASVDSGTHINLFLLQSQSPRPELDPLMHSWYSLFDPTNVSSFH